MLIVSLDTESKDEKIDRYELMFKIADTDVPDKSLYAITAMESIEVQIRPHDFAVPDRLMVEKSSRRYSPDEGCKVDS